MIKILLWAGGGLGALFGAAALVDRWGRRHGIPDSCHERSGTLR